MVRKNDTQDGSSGSATAASTHPQSGPPFCGRRLALWCYSAPFECVMGKFQRLRSEQLCKSSLYTLSGSRVRYLLPIWADQKLLRDPHQ